MKILLVFFILNSTFASGFLNEVGKRVKKRAKGTFSKNMENDTASAVDEVSWRKLNERAKRKKSRSRIVASQRSCPVNATNPLKFSYNDLKKIDAYAKRLGVDRATAIKIIVTSALDK